LIGIFPNSILKSILLGMTLSPYHRFIIENEKLWKHLPDRERRILIAVLGQDPQDPMRVMDIIQRADLGSQATIHAALTNLQKTDFLRYTSYKEDGRSKFISLAPKSVTLFKRLDKLFITCAKSPQIATV